MTQIGLLHEKTAAVQNNDRTTVATPACYKDSNFHRIIYYMLFTAPSNGINPGRKLTEFLPKYNAPLLGYYRGTP